MKRRAVIGLGDELADILAGDDAMHACDGARRAACRCCGCGRAAPCARNTLPYSMPGRRRLCTYSARPVTLARTSRRGMSRPTWFIASLPRAFGQRLPHGAPHDRPAAIRACRRPSHGRRRGSTPRRRPLRRRARSAASSGAAPCSAFSAAAMRVTFSVAALTTTIGSRIAPSLMRERHRNAERRPIVGGARGDFHVGRLAAVERRHRHGGDQLVLLQHGLVIAGVKLFDRQFALAVRTGDRNPRAERGEHRRQIHVRIAVRQRAADARDVAHADIRQRPHRALEHRQTRRDIGVVLDLRSASPWRRCAARRRRSTVMRECSGSMRVQADQPRRLEHAGLHHQHQRGAARDRRGSSAPRGSSSDIASLSDVGSTISNGIIQDLLLIRRHARPCAGHDD